MRLTNPAVTQALTRASGWNRTTLLSGLGVGLLTSVLQSSFFAFLLCTLGSSLFVLLFWQRRKAAPLHHPPLLVDVDGEPIVSSESTSHPPSWLIQGQKPRRLITASAVTLLVLSVMLSSVAIRRNASFAQRWIADISAIAADTTSLREHQAALPTRAEVAALEARLLGSMHDLGTSLGSQTSSQPFQEADLVSAVERLARSVANGELDLSRPLDSFTPSDLLTYLEAQRGILALNRENLQRSLAEQSAQLDRELAAVAMITGRYDVAEQVASGMLSSDQESISGQVILSFVLRNRGSTEEAEERLRAATGVLADSKSYSSKEASVAYDHLGSILGAKGEFEEAEGCYRKAIELAATDQKRAGIAVNLAGLLEQQGRLEEASSEYEAALPILVESGDKLSLAVVWGNLGHRAARRKDYAEAEKLYQQSLEANRALGRREGISYQTANLGRIHQMRGELEMAEELLRKALEIAEEIQHAEYSSHFRRDLAANYRLKGELAPAEDLLLEALGIDEKLGLGPSIAKDCLSLGFLAYERKEIDRAEELWRRALDVATSSNDLDSQSGAANNLALILGERGQFADAAEMQARALRASERLGRWPDVAKYYASIGIYWSQSGDKEKAKSALSKASETYTKVDNVEMAEATKRIMEIVSK